MSVHLVDVHKSFLQGNDSIHILRGVSLDIASGETVAIIGQSGSGKSTLLSLMAGLDVPSQGKIVVKDRVLSDLNESELARFRSRSISIVFQQFHLLSTLTALENVALPLDIARVPNARQKAAEALAQVGLSHRERHFPHQLSGGECQRVAIARAFVVNPEILLADEPSGNLDTDSGHKVMELLFSRVKETGMTLVLVTHNEALARQCHRCVNLENGRLVEKG